MTGRANSKGVFPALHIFEKNPTTIIGSMPHPGGDTLSGGWKRGKPSAKDLKEGSISSVP